MAGVARFLLALLLGFMLGAGTALWAMQSGAADFIIARTHAVQDLQHRLADVEQQRDQLRRQLDDVVGRAGRMEASFTELERRFRDLQEQLEQARKPGTSE